MADDQVKDREAAIVAAYLAGKKVHQIEAEFGVGRSTIYHFLRRSGQVPARTQRRFDAAAKDAALAGLYELIQLQDRRIAEQEAENGALRAENASLAKRLRRYERVDSKTSKAG